MYSYKLTKIDYSFHYLFQVSQDTTKTKRFWKKVVFLGIVLFIISFHPFQGNNDYSFTGTIIINGIILSIFAITERNSYRKEAEKVAIDSYKNVKDIYTELSFNESAIIIKQRNEDFTNESNISLNALTQVIETKKHIFIKFKTSETLIIPKRIENIEILKNQLRTITEKLKIQFQEQLNWRWK